MYSVLFHTLNRCCFDSTVRNKTIKTNKLVMCVCMSMSVCNPVGLVALFCGGSDVIKMYNYKNVKSCCRSAISF